MAKRSPGRDAPFHAVRMRRAGMKLGACMAVGDIQVIIGSSLYHVGKLNSSFPVLR
jgi:hypothetical protein